MPGNLLALGDSDGFISFWNVNSGSKVGSRIKASGATVNALSLGINNTQLVGGFDDSKGTVWNTVNNKKVYGLTDKNGHSDSILALQVVSNKLVATASADYTIK